MIYNKKKHYYDPYDSLDVEWKARISHEMLSTGNVAHLSGSSPHYINRLVANGELLQRKTRGETTRLLGRTLSSGSLHFLLLPTPLSVTPVTLKELKRYTGMGRCWMLKFATRNSIPSYYVGMYPRFCKSAYEDAWQRESVSMKRWLTIDDR